MLTFTMQSGGYLHNMNHAGSVLSYLEELGASAVGFNCVPADRFTPLLVRDLCRYIKGPLVCKPNAGVPIITENGPDYGGDYHYFAQTLKECRDNGAQILGGCCGSTPDHIKATYLRLV